MFWPPPPHATATLVMAASASPNSARNIGLILLRGDVGVHLSPSVQFSSEGAMGLLDGIIGGAVGAEMVTVVNGLIQRHGGISGILQQFQAQGLGDTVKSWVSTGPNQPISPDQVHKALGSDTITELAAKLGISPQELSAKLSTVLPQVVDKMTPTGVVPPGQ